AAGDGVGEVPAALGLGGHERRPHVAALVLVPLHGGEEVELVLEDGAAEGAPEVVPLQRGLLLMRLLQEEVGGVPLVTPPEPVAAAVELVGPAPGHQVDLGPTRLAELG